MSAPDPDELFAAHLATVRQRADRALKAAGAEALVFGAGSPPLKFQDDQHYAFAPSAGFLAFAPILDAPGSCVVHQPGRRPKLLFHAPRDYWHQPPRLPEAAWLAEFDVIEIHEPAEASAHVPPGAAYFGPEPAWLGAARFTAVNPPAAQRVLDYGRAAKTAYELDCLARASARGAAGHRAALAAWTAGLSEFEIHLAYLEATAHEEAELPYASIIAANEAAAVLHYTVRRRERLARRSLLIDAGAQYRGYAADITRTHAEAPGPLADLVAAIDALQQSLCALVTPGRDYAEIQAATHRGIAAILVAHGLVRGSAEAALENRLTSVFFPHGVGHLLGLQVHDVGGFMADEAGGTIARPATDPYLRLTRRLEPGFVVTIEPGLYFIDLLLDAARADGRGRDIDWARVEALKAYGGVRIEDNVVALEAGPRNLTREAFAGR